MRESLRQPVLASPLVSAPKSLLGLRGDSFFLPCQAETQAILLLPPTHAGQRKLGSLCLCKSFLGDRSRSPPCSGVSEPLQASITSSHTLQGAIMRHRLENSQSLRSPHFRPSFPVHTPNRKIFTESQRHEALALATSCPRWQGSLESRLEAMETFLCLSEQRSFSEAMRHLQSHHPNGHTWGN